MPRAPKYRKVASLHKSMEKRIAKYRNTAIYMKSTELRYMCLDVGLKVPRATKYRTAVDLHRKYGKL